MMSLSPGMSAGHAGDTSPGRTITCSGRTRARTRYGPARGAGAGRAEVERYLEGLFSEEGVRLTAGQTAEVLNELTGSRGATLSMGDPGTAKTSTLKVIERFNEEVLVPQGREHISINLAYTGNAARELSLATDKPACTLSSFENGNPASKFALQRENREPPMVVVAR